MASGTIRGDGELPGADHRSSDMGGTRMIRITKILYPTDFSSYSNQAYFHAVALAEKHQASLTIAYVYAPAPPAGKPSGKGGGDRRHWQEQLQQIRPMDVRIPVHHAFLEGDPASEIVRYAADAGIDLIVMGTHGRTGLERQLMGSVAEKVMRDAPCSVLVVKLPKGMTFPDRGDVEVVGASR
jgi:nucleotide-binding universal stress UspA family protein